MLAFLLINKLLRSYLILFFWSFFAATIFPGTSEVYLIVLLNDAEIYWLIPVIIATIGNSLGGITTYYMGYFTANYLAKKEKISSKFNLNEKALALIKKYGSFALILSWVPLIGDILVGFAGALKLPKTSSFFWMTLGKFLRYAIIAGITMGIIAL